MIPLFKAHREKIFAGFEGAPQNFADPRETKKNFQKKFPKSKKIFCPLQTHSSVITSSQNFSNKSICDGIYTTEKNFLCTVKTADCIGALFYNPDIGVIAAIHAGWRGLAQKIFSEFLQNFSPQEQKKFLVALSPSLKKCCAEFSDPYQETPKFFHDFIEEKTPEKFFVDLPSIAQKELLDMGIEEKNIQMPEFCTKCEKNFWSHRNGDLERNVSYIFLR